MKVIFGAAASADNDVGICALKLLKMLLRFQVSFIGYSGKFGYINVECGSPE